VAEAAERVIGDRQMRTRLIDAGQSRFAALDLADAGDRLVAAVSAPVG
jgi:hypothetical protein